MLDDFTSFTYLQNKELVLLVTNSIFLLVLTRELHIFDELRSLASEHTYWWASLVAPW